MQKLKVKTTSLYSINEKSLEEVLADISLVPD